MAVNGDAAVRVDACLVDRAAVDATSVFEDAAVDVDPRVSLACVAWKRDTVDLVGAAFSPVVESVSERVPNAGAGVGGGERKATFFWMSLVVPVLMLPFVVLRELRPAES